MSIRPLKLPEDLDILYTLIIEAFQYPENPEWNIDSDQVDGLKDTLKTIRRIWPLYRMINWMTPALRDALLGYFWEEDGEAVGLVTISRRGSGDSWLVGNVAVLPDYRRRGIAQKLVESGLDYIRKASGDLVVLDVIAGNLPAYKLYEKLGFEHYTSIMDLNLKSKDVPTRPNLPKGIIYERIPLREWEIPMELAKRVVPENIQFFDPITKSRYHRPLALLLFFSAMNRKRGIVRQDFVLRETVSREVVAVGSTSTQTKPGDRHSINMNLGPEHADLVPYLVQFMLHEVIKVSPDHTIQTGLWKWRYFALDAHIEAGFEVGKEGHRMGLKL